MKSAFRARLLVVALMALPLIMGACADPDSLPSDDETIHGAFLASVWRKPSGLLVIQRRSAVDAGDAEDWTKTWGFARKELKSLRADTCDAFVRANATSDDLSTVIKFSKSHVFVTAEELEKHFAGDIDQGWKQFYRDHPGAQGILRLSLPGISPDGHQALLYVQDQRGGLDGYGGFYLFERNGSQWRVAGFHRTYVS